MTTGGVGKLPESLQFRNDSANRAVTATAIRTAGVAGLGPTRTPATPRSAKQIAEAPRNDFTARGNRRRALSAIGSISRMTASNPPRFSEWRDARTVARTPRPSSRGAGSQFQDRIDPAPEAPAASRQSPRTIASLSHSCLARKDQVRCSWMIIVRRSVRQAGSSSSLPPSSVRRIGQFRRLWLASHCARVRLSGVRTPRSASRGPIALAIDRHSRLSPKKKAGRFASSRSCEFGAAAIRDDLRRTDEGADPPISPFRPR